MRITKRQLRRIIREQMTHNEAQLVFDAAGLSPEERIEVQNALVSREPEWMSTSSYEKLFDYYAFETREMPPEIAKAETGEPDDWILDELEG